MMLRIKGCAILTIDIQCIVVMQCVLKDCYLYKLIGMQVYTTAHIHTSIISEYSADDISFG